MDPRITGPAPRRGPGPETLDEMPGEHSRFTDVWSGILHEFRNHLKVLSAAATELRAEMPPSLALHVTEAVSETERNVQSLGTLLSLADVSLREAESVVTDLDQVLDRAIRLAAPAVGRAVSIIVVRGPHVGVRNRGNALECLLAALIIDLARAADGRNVEAALRAPRIGLKAEAGRGGLAIEIESNGLPPVAGSWRTILASDLAARLEATLSPLPEGAGFDVQLH
jgi:nitrogen-specific signal transduction histidine kinase